MLLQPVYEALFGFHVFGLGFVTSMAFIFCTGNCHCSCMRCNMLCLYLMHPKIVPWLLKYVPIPAGVFVSSWLGSLLLQVGEWIIKKLPLVKHIYSAAKQVSAAVNPANETTQSFRECVLIRHPRNGEFAFGFITGQTLLQVTSVCAVGCNPLQCKALYVPEYAL